jgi:hypothetical protein
MVVGTKISAFIHKNAKAIHYRSPIKMAGQSARLVRLNLGLSTSSLLIYLISAKKSSICYDLVKKSVNSSKIHIW